MANWTELQRPLADLAADVRSMKLTAVELVQASLDRIAETQDYHVVLEVNPQALEQARVVDARVAAGEDLPLAGLPFAAKDTFLTFDTHTTASSNILKPFRAPYQGPIINRLQAAGAVLVAKVNNDAFGHGASTENSDFGPSRNPHDPTRVPGGSSGGSSASVALGQVTFAVGGDTGGSNRQPAALCGVVGFRPTYGLVPRTGTIAMASSFDTIGMLTNRMSDLALVLETAAGRDDSDATSIERDPKPYTVPAGSLKGLKIGLITEQINQPSFHADAKQQLLALVEQLRARGAVIEDISMPATELGLATYYILIPAEVSSNLARYDGVKFGYTSPKATNLEETYRLSREEGFGAEAKRRIMIGTYVLSSGYYDAYYKRAQKVRTKLIAEFNDAFQQCDLLLGPTAPGPAFPIGAKAQDPLAMYAEDVMTVPPSIVGIPAVSIPFAAVEKLPVGLQVMAPQRAERNLFAAAQAIEEVIGDWRARS